MEEGDNGSAAKRRFLNDNRSIEELLRVLYQKTNSVAQEEHRWFVSHLYKGRLELTLHAAVSVLSLSLALSDIFSFFFCPSLPMLLFFLTHSDCLPLCIALSL